VSFEGQPCGAGILSNTGGNAMNDLNTLERSVRVLSIDLDEVGRQLDAAEERGDDLAADSLERIWLVKEGLLAEAQRKLENFRSDAARRSAEARLAHHAANDTLDLY
jgi:hypothetical protein